MSVLEALGPERVEKLKTWFLGLLEQRDAEMLASFGERDELLKIRESCPHTAPRRTRSWRLRGEPLALQAEYCLHCALYVRTTISLVVPS